MPRRVLVVDDNLDAAESLAALVELLGHKATVIHDGRDALGAAAAERPDVTLLDIGLPGRTDTKLRGACARCLRSRVCA